MAATTLRITIFRLPRPKNGGCKYLDHKVCIKSFGRWEKISTNSFHNSKSNPKKSLFSEDEQNRVPKDAGCPLQEGVF